MVVSSLEVVYHLHGLDRCKMLIEELSQGFVSRV